MKKNFLMVSATLVLSLGTVFGIKSYNNSINTPSLMASNIEALSSGDPKPYSGLTMHCANNQDECVCTAQCPNCKVMIQLPDHYGQGAYFTGKCDCGYKF